MTSFSGPVAKLQLANCSQLLRSKLPIDQAFWRNALVSGSLVDYLWDLEPDLCLQKDSGSDTTWDWRRLGQDLKAPNLLCIAIGNSIRDYCRGQDEDENIVRQPLAIFQEGCLTRVLSGHTMFDDAPRGLASRCRIARIVRDVEIMDRIEANEPFVVRNGRMVR